MSGSNVKKAKDRKRRVATPKNRHSQRGYPVLVFFSEEELNILNEKWPKFGFANRSDYVRFVLVHGVIDEVSIKFHVNASAAKKAIKAKDKGAEVDE